MDGNACFLLDGNGGLVSREEYYPFGETSFCLYGRQRYRFCGKERDEESGLYYYGARYYAPWCCRFVSVDPLAAEYPFYTPYQYAGNKPIIAIDIDGLEGEVDTGPQSGRQLPNTRSPGKFRQLEGLNHLPNEANIGDDHWKRLEGDIVTQVAAPESSKAPEPVKNKSFAIYVAFPDQTARLGRNDNSLSSLILRGAGLENVDLPVEHAGIILGDGTTGQTYYFDFGRFDKSLYRRTGEGITRAELTNPGLSTIDAEFDANGNPSNSKEIVKSLIEGPDSYFAIGNYGRVDYGTFPNLDFERMFNFATSHGNVVFGTDGDDTFCAQFANDCIRAGGGRMIDIKKTIKEKRDEWARMYFIDRLSLEEIARLGPVPSSQAQIIRQRYPELHKNYTTLNTRF